MKLRLNIFANYQYFNVVLKQFSNLTFFIIPPSSVRQKFISNFIIYEQWPLSENWEECFVSDNPSNKKATKSHNKPLLWWSKNPPITHPFCKLQKLFIILQGSKAILQIVFSFGFLKKVILQKLFFILHWIYLILQKLFVTLQWSRIILQKFLIIRLFEKVILQKFIVNLQRS